MVQQGLEQLAGIRQVQGTPGLEEALSMWREAQQIHIALKGSSDDHAMALAAAVTRLEAAVTEPAHISTTALLQSAADPGSGVTDVGPFPEGQGIAIGLSGLKLLLAGHHRLKASALRSLRLPQQQLRHEGVMYLAEALASRILPFLEELDLSDDGWGPEAGDALMKALQEVGRQLHVLIIQKAALLPPGIKPGLGEGNTMLQLAKLVREKSLVRLHVLDLAGQVFETEGAFTAFSQSLKSADALPDLRTLDLSNATIPPEAATHLFEALTTPGAMPHLLELRLRGRHLKALAGVELGHILRVHPTLHTLDLSDGDLLDRASSRAWDSLMSAVRELGPQLQLSELWVENERGGEVSPCLAIQELAQVIQAGGLRSLTVLALTGNKCCPAATAGGGDTGICCPLKDDRAMLELLSALATCRLAPQLRELRVNGMEMMDQAGRELARMLPQAPSLLVLEVGASEVGLKAVIEALMPRPEAPPPPESPIPNAASATAAAYPAIQTLHLSCGAPNVPKALSPSADTVTSALSEVLAHPGAFPELTTLTLTLSKPSATGVKALGKVLTDLAVCPRLTRLEIRRLKKSTLPDDRQLEVMLKDARPTLKVVDSRVR